MKKLFTSSLFIVGEKRWMVVVMLGLYLIMAFLELLGIGLIIPFIGLMQDQHSLDNSRTSDLIANLLGLSDRRGLLTLYGVSIILLFLFKGWFRFVVQKGLVRFGWNVQTSLREQVMGNYQQQAYTFHLARNSASLINVLQGHVNQFVKGFLLSSIRLMGEVLTLFMILVFLAYNYLIPTIVVMTLFGAMIVIYDQLVRRRVERIGKINAQVGADMIKALNQAIAGFKEVRIFGVERYFFDRYIDSARRMADASVELTALQILPRFLIESMMVGFIIILALVILWTTSGEGAVFTTLGVFAVAGLRILPSANQIIESISSLRHSKQYIKELEADLRSESHIMDIGSGSKNKSDGHVGAFSDTFESLVVSNLSYRYPNTDGNVIDSVDFILERGQVLGIVGTSGAGKTTMVDLVLGLLTPTSGQINVNGASIHDDIKAWRNRLAYIPQTTLLIDDSLQRNIALGQPDDKVDNERLKQALKLAQLEKVVKELPEGLDTVVAEGGVRLSGGQRQRVALARAFYYNRELIIMDEATSALDNETEREIVEAIESIRGNTTLIVIAHRLTTVKGCDCLIRLEKGRIAAMGAYDEVIGKKLEKVENV